MGAHLQMLFLCNKRSVVFETECFLERVGGHMDLIIALAMANLYKLQLSAGVQAF